MPPDHERSGGSMRDAPRPTAPGDLPPEVVKVRQAKRPRVVSHGRRRLARTMFYSHLWLGVAATAILLVIAITGILLNHKRELGLMPDVPNEASAPFSDALPLAALAEAATRAVPPEVAARGVDRMDVRPGDGLIKVRFDDPRVMEVTVDIHTGQVLHVGERNDVFLEKLHSGEIFGGAWVLLSDAGALLLVVLLISGYWLWLYPKSRL